LLQSRVDTLSAAACQHFQAESKHKTHMQAIKST
jgi:hypothetical protein